MTSETATTTARMRYLLSRLLAVSAALALVAGAVLVWLGRQPSQDPHGGAYATLSGLVLCLAAAVVAGAAYLLRPRQPREDAS
jgi:drug/metabolite transporter (DMT)-like permease